MALKISLTVLLFITQIAFAKKLPELATKQDVSNIRYLTRDGKYTYYQRRSGDLLLGTNFNVSEILKSDMGTQYYIASSSSSQWIVISQQNNYQQSLDPRLEAKIFRAKKGESSTIEIGRGLNSQVQLDGNWVSFYSPFTRVITIKSLENTQIGFNIQTPTKLNPFFFPDVSMVDEQNIFYVDMNEKGESALIKFTRVDGKSKVIFKPEGINRRLELCSGFGKTYLGAFPYQQLDGASEIWEISADKGLTKPIYTSSLPDIGHMVCDHTEGKIFFSKAFKLGKAIRHDIYSLETKDSKLEAISDLRYATSLINFDGLLLIPYQNKFYVPLDQKQVGAKESLSVELKENK